VSDLQNEAASTATTHQSVDQQPKSLSMFRRVLLCLCGLVLVLGFFLPWVTAGTALELSGLGLAISGGEMVQAVSGGGRFLLFLAPLMGAALIAGAVTGHWATPWVGILGSGALLLFGIIHVISFFLSSTGVGLWLVVFAALFTLVVGALPVGGRS
jgi:hypothetical protein